MIGKLILYTVTAGIIGSTAGGLLGVLFRGSGPRTTSAVLSLAGGIMVSLVGFELIPESLEAGGIFAASLSLLAGALLVLLLNRLLGNEHGCAGAAEGGAPCACSGPQKGGQAPGNRALLRAGILLVAALAVHNLPEGFAVGAGMAGGAQEEFGLRVALLIALHNIPDGMAISISLTAGGMSRARAVGLTALSGVPTVLGGLLGWWLGGISELLVSLALGLAGGALLSVTFCELLPASNRMGKTEAPALFVVLGIILGLVVAAAGG